MELKNISITQVNSLVFMQFFLEGGERGDFGIFNKMMPRPSSNSHILIHESPSTSLGFMSRYLLGRLDTLVYDSCQP